MSIQIRKICSELYALIDKEDSLRVYKDLFCTKNTDKITLALINYEPTLCGTLEAENQSYHFEMKIRDFRPDKENESVLQKMGKLRERAFAALRDGPLCTSRPSKISPSSLYAGPRSALSLTSSETEERDSSHPILKHHDMPASSTYSRKGASRPPSPPVLETKAAPLVSPDHARLIHLHEREREASYALARQISDLEFSLESQGLEVDSLKQQNLALIQAIEGSDASIRSIATTSLALKAKLLQAALLISQLHKGNKAFVLEIEEQRRRAQTSSAETLEAKQALSLLESHFEERFLAIQRSYEQRIAPVNEAIVELTQSLDELQSSHQEQLEKKREVIVALGRIVSDLRQSETASQEQIATLEQEMLALRSALASKEASSSALESEVHSLKEALALLPAKQEEELSQVREDLAQEFTLSLARVKEEHALQIKQLEAEEEERIAQKVQTATLTLRRDQESEIRTVRAAAGRDIATIRQECETQMRILRAQREGEAATIALSPVPPPTAIGRKAPVVLELASANADVAILADPSLAPGIRELEALRRQTATLTLFGRARIAELQQQRETLLEGNKALASRLLDACRIIDLQKKELGRLGLAREEPPSWRELAAFAAKYALGMH